MRMRRRICCLCSRAVAVSTLLQQDLQAMGAKAGEETLPQSNMESSAVIGDPRSIFLGRMYVMEGSTLGGQYIARHVEETLGLSSGEGNSYFRGYGEATGERWREFPGCAANAARVRSRDGHCQRERYVRDLR